MGILAGVLLLFSWVLGFDLSIKLCVPLFAIAADPEGAFVGRGHVFATTVAAEWSARMAWALLAGLTIPVVLPEVVSTAATSTNQNVSRAAGARMAPRLTLSAKGLRRKLDPSFAWAGAPREVDHGAHKAMANISLIIIDNRDDNSRARHTRL